MRLRNFAAPTSESSPHVSRLARILAERLDPDDEYDCDVTIAPVSNDTIADHPANDLPTRGYEFLHTDEGVEIIITFDDNADCPDVRSGNLVADYDDAVDTDHGITFLSSFSGRDGTFHALAFPVLDKEFNPMAPNRVSRE